jgi:hypothetical protein
VVAVSNPPRSGSASTCGFARFAAGRSSASHRTCFRRRTRVRRNRLAAACASVYRLLRFSVRVDEAPREGCEEMPGKRFGPTIAVKFGATASSDSVE